MQDELNIIIKDAKNLARLEIKNHIMDILIETKKNEQYEYDKMSRIIGDMKQYHQGRADAFRIAQIKLESIINMITPKNVDQTKSN